MRLAQLLVEGLSILDAKRIFGIEQIPQQAELKALYKKLSKENHPDVGGSDEKMKLINAAYDMLQKERPGTGSVRTREDWEERERKQAEENRRHFATMQEMFKESFQLPRLIAYLEKFVQPLKATVDISDMNISSYRYHNTFNAMVKIGNEDNTTVFFVKYSIWPRDTAGGLSHGDVDERDIIYSVSVITNIYHDNRKHKMARSEWNFNAGRTSIAEPETLFPEKKLKKILGATDKKHVFKKADMLLGLRRELNAEINDDGKQVSIMIYPFEKADKISLTMWRSVIMRTAAYHWNKVRIADRAVWLGSGYIAETEESLRKLVDTVKEIRERGSRFKTDPDEFVRLAQEVVKRNFSEK